MKKELYALMDSAKTALSKSYSPYSNFKVGASLLALNGKIYQGANIENASYSLTLCAERVAINNAIMDNNRQFSAMAIYHNDDKTLPTPCGACLQVISEFVDDMTVIVFNDKTVLEYTLRQLLPYSFKI